MTVIFLESTTVSLILSNSTILLRTFKVGEVHEVAQVEPDKFLLDDNSVVEVPEKSYSILLGEVVPEFVPCRPYIEVGDFTVRWYHNGDYYDTDELPAKFLIGK
jgi:hypothetical protein